MDISVVIPLYNEAESLPELFAWIERVMKEHNFSYEVIFINDGSTDNSCSFMDWDAGLSVRFRRPENNTLASSIGMLALSIIVCIAMNLNCNFWIYEGLLIILLFMMGFSFTSTTALAMECEREHAGTASALSSAVGFGFGGLVSPLVGLGDTMVTTGIVFMACATCSLGCILWARKINAFREVSPIMRKRATSAPA